MKSLSTVTDVTDFVKRYRNRNNTTAPGEIFLENLNSIITFEGTSCKDTDVKKCLKGFIVKNENATIFTDQIPKSSCEHYLTMQLVKESITASKRDYTEVGSRKKLTKTNSF